MKTRVRAICLVASTLALFACKDDKEEPEEVHQPTLEAGEACDPEVEPVDTEGFETDGEELPPICAPGLACEPVVDSEGHVCGTALEIRGRITDSLTGEAIEGALIAALDEIGSPVTDVVSSDACGDYVLPLSVRRAPDGSFAETPKWTLNVSAQDYLPFPAGLRPALPVDIADAVDDPDGAEPNEAAETDTDVVLYTKDVIENPATNVGLIPLGANDVGGATVSGTVAGENAPGTLVVAEGAEGRRPYGIADASGDYTLFNVPSGESTIRGYRQGLEVEPASVMVGAEDIVAVDLPVVSTNPDDIGQVSGSLNIVNAQGGSMTSVVLVPASVFNEALERGPVPFGLRSPPPPTAPDVTSDFAIAGVPSGTYKVLVAFENDDLVRDPDEGIAGTAIQEITRSFGESTGVAEAFKVTEALAIVGPGNEAPEQVEAAPTFVWADDSSEDFYQVLVFNALGEMVWEVPDLPGVSGSETAQVTYGGPALLPGMYYQFRATSFRELPNETLAISRTEDLRGVFVFGEAPPLMECTIEDTDGGTDGDTD